MTGALAITASPAGGPGTLDRRRPRRVRAPRRRLPGPLSGAEAITRGRARGFTLLEVMIGLALLGLGLTVLIKSAAGNIFNAEQAHMIGIATDLARGKMYELEEKLIKDGFSDTEQHEEDQTFDDEGWPAIRYSYKIEVIELPSFGDLQTLTQGSGSAGRGSGSGEGEGEGEGGFQNSLLGGLASQFGFGGGSGDVGAAAGASFVQGQYALFQQILKDTIRKVTLTVTWQVLGSDRDMTVVAFFTDAAAMDKVLSGLGSQEIQPGGGGGSDDGGDKRPPEPS